MIGYVTLGTNDLPRRAGFYDTLLPAFGMARMMETGKVIACGLRECQGTGIGLTRPFSGQAATADNVRDPDGSTLNLFFTDHPPRPPAASV